MLAPLSRPEENSFDWEKGFFFAYFEEKRAHFLPKWHRCVFELVFRVVLFVFMTYGEKRFSCVPSFLVGDLFFYEKICTWKSTDVNCHTVQSTSHYFNYYFRHTGFSFQNKSWCWRAIWNNDIFEMSLFWLPTRFAT